LNKSTKKSLVAGIGLAVTYMIMKVVVSWRVEDQHIDDCNPYLKNSVNFVHDDQCVCTGGNVSLYERLVKPAIDKTLSFIGLVILSPLIGVIALIVFIDDPGPVFFTQKRIGKDKSFFMLHKFRTMRMSTPHDVPTHMLSNPEAYITCAGSVLRKTSLDEIPQIWDIFRGKMSIIGPRPALWNQEDLIAERSRYGADAVLPGLTGFAQIRGRDKLEILDKARMDGEYVKVLKQGGIKAFLFDIKIFCETIGSVLRHDGVIEGGDRTPSISSNGFQVHSSFGQKCVKKEEVGFETYGHRKKFKIDKKRKVKVLITGANSYIGESFKIYCKRYYPNISIDTVDMMNSSWKEYDFSPYDSVFHVAGIAHADVRHISSEEKKQYYAVNTKLVMETAQHARDAGVSQFIFMSSMIVYGNQEFIDEYTIPEPVNFYGDSKWQADKGVRKLENDQFYVAVLRPPMIYGRGSNGNYSILAQIARKIPVFPDYNNKRSMLYIDNLCEFVSQLVLSGEGGVYFPQNAEYTSTSHLVREISITTDSPTYTTKFLKPAVSLVSHVPGKIKILTKKAFGNCYYDQGLSVYDGIDYQIYNLRESIIATEASELVEDAQRKFE